MSSRTTALLSLLMATFAAPSFGAEQPSAAPDPAAAQRAACEALKFADFSQIADAPTRVAESIYVEADANGPATCLTRGYVAPQVGFQLKLPVAGWNGKLVELGSGGFTGTTQSPGEIAWCSELVRRGYACIHSDHGHTSGVSDKSIASLDGVWAYNNPQAEIDYAYRALHVVGLAQKAIARKYYGAEEQQHYFLGCSGGGRQALLAAQRFPEDFDGIVAMEPAINLSGAFMAFLYHHRSVTDAGGKPLFTMDDLSFLRQRALAQCDKDDGVADGVIGNPRACEVDLDSLACAEGQSGQCLSPAQISAARKMYAGPVTSKGRHIYPGHTMPGAETGTFGFGVTKPVALLALADFFRYMAFVPDPGPDWKLSDFDFDQDYARLATMEQLYAASNPDLRAFRQAGGKLIVVQGWDDSGTPFPLATIDWYENVEKVMGGRKRTQEFARLFMVPGRAHCAGGPGAGAADFLGSIESWVEQGRAPDLIKAAHSDSTDPADGLRGPIDDSKVKFTRPLYPYPLRAQYKGSGDPNDYRSFKPVEK